MTVLVAVRAFWFFAFAAPIFTYYFSVIYRRCFAYFSLRWLASLLTLRGIKNSIICIENSGTYFQAT